MRTAPSISVIPATICSADRQQRTFSRLRERRYRTIPQLQAERAASPELSTLKANPRTGLPDSNRNDVWWSADGKEWHEVAPTPWLPRHANSVFVFDGSLWMGAQTSLAGLSVSFLPILLTFCVWVCSLGQQRRPLDAGVGRLAPAAPRRQPVTTREWKTLI